MEQQMQNISREGIGIYIHVPFCASKCGYCDFYSRVRRDQMEGYLDALVQEMNGWKHRRLKADTVFFGGGTPSLLSSVQLGRVMNAVRENFELLPDAEITMEANPETVDTASLKAAYQLGINRLSYGVQSAVDQELKALGRKHTFARAAQAVLDAREAGFSNISLDLMLGIPYQTAESLQTTLTKILSLAPQHISCYLLKIEEGTLFYKKNAAQWCASEDETADFYLTVARTLGAAGYQHYEISNFALPGYESRHNLKYWRDEPYIGFGPAAHSCMDGKRFYNPSDLGQYIDTHGLCSVPEESGAVQDASERLMLGLRLSEGIDLSEIGKLDADFDTAAQQAFLKKASVFEKAGLLTVSGSRVCLTEEGMLVSNILLARLLPD